MDSNQKRLIPKPVFPPALPLYQVYRFQFSSVQSFSRIWLCNPMNRSTPGLPVHHQLQESYVHQVIDAIQPSHPLSSPSPPAPNPYQHQGLFQWVSSLHEVAKVQVSNDHLKCVEWLASKVNLRKLLYCWVTSVEHCIFIFKYKTNFEVCFLWCSMWITMSPTVRGSPRAVYTAKPVFVS